MDPPRIFIYTSQRKIGFPFTLNLRSIDSVMEEVHLSQSVFITRGQRQYRSLPTGEIKIPNFPGVPSPPRKPSLLILLAPTGAMLALSLLVGLITKSPTMGTFLLISGPAMSLVAFLRYHQQCELDLFSQ